MDILLAEVTPPEINTSYVLNLISRIAHILGAIVLLGGISYLRKVTAPALARKSERAPKRLYGGGRSAWAKWVGIATLLLLVSGFYNYLQIVRTNEKMPGVYHMLFGIKFLAALVVFFLAAILAGRTEAAERFRGQAKRWLTLCLACGVLVVVLGSIMRSFPHEPKATAAEAEAPVVQQ
jgi:uncharacterized membrane protein